METKAVAGIVGGVLLIGALVAILAVQGDPAGPNRTYQVAWETRQAGSTSLGDALDEGEQSIHIFPVSRANVTHVHAWLNWTDDVGDPDTFRLRVDPPNGTTQETASENGSIHLMFTPSLLPSPVTVTAESESDAQRELRGFSSPNGTGSWLVTVNLTDAPGQRPVPQAPQLETQPDGSNTYQLEFTVHVFEPTLTLAPNATAPG